MAATITQRLVRGAPGRLRHECVDGDGQPFTPAAPPTLVAVDADGVTVVASGAMTADADVGEGAYYRDVTATQTAALGVWTVTVTVDTHPAVTTADVAPARLLTIRDLVALEPSLGTAEPAVLRRALLDAEIEAEWICGQAFVTRWRRSTLDGSGVRVLTLEPEIRSVTSLTVDDVAWDVADLVVDDDMVRHLTAAFPIGVGNVTVTYLAGLEAAPVSLTRALARRVRSIVFEGVAAHPDRASTVTVDGSTWSLRDPGALETGIGWVDAVYTRHSRRRSATGPDGADGGGYAPAYARIDVDPGAESRLFGRHR